jgi:alanine dehydrogenase
MTSRATLLLSRAEIVTLLNLGECIDAVERAFSAHAEGRSLPPGILGIHANDGGFHIKAAGLELSRPYFALKVNGNFFHNQERFGMPRIQGLIVLADAENGAPLAVLDSIEITILRTGAATGVSIRYLARDDAKIATICGCGNQGRVSLRALTQVRQINEVFAYDIDPDQSRRYAGDMSKELGIRVTAVRNLEEPVGKSDICITCSPSREPYLLRSYVRPGTFIAAVGADDEAKQEIDAELLAASKVVVDNLEQCATIGDLKLALGRGLMTRADVHAELGGVIVGRKPGRESADEVIIFDSTGTALQDVAAAALVYERAVASGRGHWFDFQ